MDAEPKAKVKYTAEYIIAAGYFLLFCLAFISCLVFYYLTFSQKPTAPVNVFATNLPPTTPTPHISVQDQTNIKTLFEDDFSKDTNHWTLERDSLKEEVQDGKLYFESRIENNYAYTGCKSCPYLNKPFYLEADFATSEATDQGFGIVFGLNYFDSGFYIFQINTESKKYYFFHHIKDDWSLRASGETDHIKPFPESNTLGIYANADTLEFYVNGEIVDSYKQSGRSFHYGDFSFFVGNRGFQLIVDNVRITEVGTQ